MSALVWKQMEGEMSYATTFPTQSFDGDRLVKRNCGMPGFFWGGCTNVFEQGIEKHYGWTKDPWAPFYNPHIFAFKPISTIIATLPTNYADFVEWCFVLPSDTLRLFPESVISGKGFYIIENGGIFMYGNYVIAGDLDGNIFVVNKDTGALVNTLKNPEGTTTPPLVIDGNGYGFGGNSNWRIELPAAGFPYGKAATKTLSFTPYGK